ncbi:MAG: 4Fe-4S binding protein [Coriobacteriales bacterium]|jgi:ferredoxin
MLGIRDVFEEFNKIGCCSFSTVDEDGVPHSRIAHFFAADDEGIYLRTMTVKPFYRQLKASGRVSVCGEATEGKCEWDEDKMPHFMPGTMMRVTGQVRELSLEEVQAKAAGNPEFNVAVYDIKKYPATVVFVMYRGHGERYCYDFNCVHMDHKLQRERFAFGGDTFVEPGLVISDECIGCGSCEEACTFKAIVPGEPYRIDGTRCDECGNCYLVCPVKAIAPRGAKQAQ